MAIVYRHRRLDTNEIFYVGIGKEEKRAYTKSSRNKWWKHIINKTDYSIEIIADNLSWEDACELEIFLIEQYGRKDLGLGSLINLADGGQGANGVKRNDEFKENLRILKTGTKFSDEINKKKACKGSKNGMYGKSAMKGKKHSEESKIKMSISSLGIKKSQEMKNKLSEIRKFMGYICLDLETGIFYDNLKQFSIAKNINYDKLKYDIKKNKITNIKILK